MSAFIYECNLHDIDIANLSVRLFVTLLYCIKTAKPIVKVLSPQDSSIVFCDLISSRYEISDGALNKEG